MSIRETQFADIRPREACAHCGKPVDSRFTTRPAETGEDRFCCEGCRLVYGLLRARGLEEYYRLRAASGSVREPLPAPAPGERYDYLDDPEFLQAYAPAGRMRFYLEGVHCAACVWLVEKLPDYVEGAASVRLDLGRGVASVTRAPGGSFGAIAREFARLGYRPHPVRDGEDAAFQLRENRGLLIRMGIAGACAGNIMLLAICLYGGAAGPLSVAFRWLSFLLSLPVALYCAQPFYRNSLAALRTRSLSIDVPIALGTVVAEGASLVALLTGSEHIYFDSISSLVFLLLASRYVLRRAQQSAFESSRLMHFLAPSRVRRRLDGPERFEEVSLEAVRPGDLVQVRVGEPVPVDGIIVSGDTRLNCAVLTGEAELVTAGPRAKVFAGAVNEQGPIDVRVLASGMATRLGAILKAVEEQASRKAPLVALADRWARVFVFAVLLGAPAVLLWQGLAGAGYPEGFRRALGLVIVACPCALALATPLAMTAAMGRAARAGILIKGSDVLERLSRVDKVFLDKTGTLTTGTFEVRSWLSELSREETARMVVALEQGSQHPIARALVRHFEPLLGRAPEGGAPARELHEQLGHGVRGRVNGRICEISRLPGEARGAAPGESQVGLYREGRLVGSVRLGDRVRDDAEGAVRALEGAGVVPYLISGDHPHAVGEVARRLGISERRVVWQATPELKARIVRRYDHALMVGDGANDALALSTAFAGVAVHGGLEVSLRAADAYVSRPGLLPLVGLLELARGTIRVIRRGFAISFVFNAVGLAAVLTGHAGPLFAAVLMPLSSLSVVASSLLPARRESRSRKARAS